MRRRASVAIAGFTGTLAALAALASCGSRTGLLGEEIADAGSEHPTSSPDRFVPDTPEEATEEPTEDVIEEMPGIDTNRPDVPVINPCPDAAATLIYVIGESNTLYSFNPASAVFSSIGTISCPDPQLPFSMAVDREGVAYVLFESGHLYRVSTKTAECKTTKYDSASNENVTFGMGFVANVGDGGDGDGGSGETLFVSKDIPNDGELATIDTSTFVLKNIGNYSPSVLEAELTGTGGGQLFAFQPLLMGGTSTTQTFIAQIDPTTAKVIAQDPLPAVSAGSGWAFAFWGGEFYTFTAPSGTTVVDRFDPKTMTTTPSIATISDVIVGAGVSTCAPQD